MLTENNFKKFLIDEITRSSNAPLHNAIIEVNNFSKTKEFRDCYSKWLKLNKRRKSKETIRHISQCFS
jgi:hypothetical protein